MNLERLVDEYTKRKEHLNATEKKVNELKELIAQRIDKEGDVDDKGHKHLQAGKWALTRRWNQGEPVLNKEEAMNWASDLGILDKVTYQPPRELDEDALAGWVFDHRDDPNIEAEYKKLWEPKAGYWSFISPVEKPQEYDDY